MVYAWDEAKRRSNLRKHSVDFADAVGALEDPANRTVEDGDAQGQARYQTLGMSFCDALLVVVWADSHDGGIRIISARKASPSERRHYPYEA